MEKLRILADELTSLSVEEPLLLEAYVFGEVLDGADPIDHVEVAFVLNLPPEEVQWETRPRGVGWLVEVLRLDKGGLAYWWRARDEPVPNHRIRGPVRFWSLDGTDEDVLDALAKRRLDDLPRVTADPADSRDQVASALAHLREVHQNYWDRDWRREHRGNSRYPENALWEAVNGYLDLLDHRFGSTDQESTREGYFTRS